MKKIIAALFLLFLVVSTGTSYGQLNLKIGPKVGFNASQLHTNIDSISSQFKSGFQFGIFVRMGKRVYLQPELYYTTEGGVFKSNSSSVKQWEQNIKLGSLDVPLLVGISFINSDLVNIRLLAGPVASFIVNKSISETGVTGPIVNASIKNVNWYIQAGAGVDIWRFTLDVRYQIGLNKMISEVDYQSKTINFNTSNNVWVVSLGFKFL
jgi:Outer membrane protein beta-barrel domain